MVALGQGVGDNLKIGDEICALVGSGGYAEFCLADATLCLPRPKPLSLIEAAGVPETYFTVYDNVFTRGALKAGETFLVHGGSSGIGSTAIQLAKHFGARVFATAGSAEKVAFCKSLGADVAINYREQDFVAEVKALTGKKGADVILDMVGGPYLQKNVSALAPDGRLVQIAFLQGAKVKDFDFMSMMLKRLTLTGSTLRSRPLATKAAIAAALREKVWPLLDSGAVKPVIHARFPLEQARAAHELMESSSHLGKIVLLTGK
jgi:putative PIG3 family NAD(P)H quinone oxidoreductase